MDNASPPRRFLSSSLTGVLIGLLISVMAQSGLTAELVRDVPEPEPLLLTIDASTWKTRGRLLYDVEGSIRKKLRAAGFRVTREADDPHKGLLSVTYRESQGPEYAFNAFGTIITAIFHFEPDPSRPAFEFQIVEQSANSVSGTPPYLDAIHRFETNPYYFFFGEILAGHRRLQLNLRDALFLAFQRTISSRRDPDALDRPERPDHYMMPPREFYRPFAFQRTIQVFMENKDTRIVQLWPDLFTDPDPLVRVQAIKMVRAFRVVDARSQLVNLAAHDPDPQVRNVAQATVQLFQEAS